MKIFLLAAIVTAAALTGSVSAQADTFAVHGFQGTHYGR